MTQPSLQLASPPGARKSNLAFALARLPADRRKDALVFYNFCREVDDIADEPDRSPGEKLRLLEQWKQALQENAGLPESLRDVIERRQLDRALLVEIVTGMEMDISPRRYGSYEELKSYCWRAACAVGLVSIDIFGCRKPESRIYAEHLGYALQLTNILRDVAEDAALQRIYLPMDDLARFSVSEQSILSGTPDPGFENLMRFEAARAREHFRQASDTLPREDASMLFSAEVMRAMYQKILTHMEADGLRVFEKRYRLSLLEKVIILLRGR